MDDFLDKYPLVLLPVFIFFWCTILFLISALSGWMALARRFRTNSTFTGPTWGFQTAYMRWTSHYSGCLNVGADPAGLKISVFFFFRPGHPPLLIPWSEVTVAERWKFWFFRRVRLQLGREEQVPFSINGSLADRLQAAAGTSWPIEPIS